MRDEPEIMGMRDRRLTNVVSFPAGRVVPRRIRFRVPSVRPGIYTLAVWLRGTNGWFNVADGLWRDSFVGPRLRLTIYSR
jgi:hypothetical protein